ncbi:MAG: DUF401 family protein [Dethiobacteria bacterium]|nr:DUF401 family protein [Bacillota bacterium]
MPWYIALTGSIIVILLGIYKKINIGLTMILGSAALGLLAGLPPHDFLLVLGSGLWNSITIMLIISILLLGVLGYVLKATGALEEIILNLQSLVADVRIIAVAMPALIGMLTVPGGAILSAPLCAEAGNKLNLPPGRQAVVNIWFRHVLYFMLPLFPSLILASQLSGLPMSRFVLHNLPLTIIGIVFGFYYLFRGYKTESNGFSFSGLRFWLLLKSILPLVIILFLVVFIDLYFPFALLAGIIIALLNYLPAGNKFTELRRRMKTMIIPGIKIPVALVIAGIMVYKEMLTRSEVIADLTALVLDMGIPVIALIAVIPFLVGMLTGDNSASVAVIFPMFMPLLPQEPLAYGAYLAYLYASSTAGHIISPAHPCFSLTKEFYEVEIKSIIVPILPMLGVVMAAGLIFTMLFGIH